MTTHGLAQLALYLAILLTLAWPLGRYIAGIHSGQRYLMVRLLGPVERTIYRLCGVNPDHEMGWRGYALAMLVFNVLGLLGLYALQRLQGMLPLNPDGLDAVAPDLAFNTAASFVSNTNWQAYSGETTMSYLTQMAGMTVQNFVSAAVGMAVLVALIRGLVRKQGTTLGNFWVDLTRSTLYILLPLALLFALLLVSQGVVQNLQPAVQASLLQPLLSADGQAVSQQVLASGPAASQVAITQLGTNGGGFFGVNAAHPLANPTPLSNFAELLAILLIPAALCVTYGRMVGDARQGWALLIVMVVIFVAFLGLILWSEQSGNPELAAIGVDQTAGALQAGGNMVGKEARFGIAGSTLWAAATTAASNGSVNSMHDAYTPLGGLGPLLLMQLGEVIFGGVGSGLYGMLAFVVVAVFIAGLMVGRTPEYLGKKIEAFEMKMATLVILVPAALALLATALVVSLTAGQAAISNPGPHGFSQILYAFSSQAANNGSAFAGLGVNTPLYNLTGGLAMLFARFWAALPILAIAGSLVKKQVIPVGSGTLPTHTPLFIAWLAAVVLVVGALSFLPALALGPIVEQILLHQGVLFSL